MTVRPTDFGDERHGVASYLDALREHWLLVLSLVALAVGLAAAYSFTAEKRYEAEADLLVTPLASTDDVYVGIPSLLRETGQGRAALTAARLVKSPAVADAVRRRLGLSTWSRERILGAVDITPVGQSNIVTITGNASEPELAARFANGFANALIDQRTEIFQQQLQSTIRALQARLRAIPPDQRTVGEGAALAGRLGSLVPLSGQSDPTLQVSSAAVPPESPSWPRPVLTIAIALFASVLLGVGAAVALELVTPRVNREEELLLVQRLPILTRVPRMPKSLVRAYLTGRQPLPGNAREAYRTLRARLTSGRDERFPESILITSAMPGEGKTMTSVNLAIGLSTAGMRVILVDGDLRRPMVATLFGVATRPRGFASVLMGESSVEESLVPAPGHGDGLRLLLASPEHAHLVDLLDPERVERVLAELRLSADVVVIDSPPLTEVADALTLADEVDAIIVAVRLGRTRRDRLNELRRVLAQRSVSPVGFVVTTRKTPRGQGYYYGSKDGSEPAPPDGRLARRPALVKTDGDDEF